MWMCLCLWFTQTCMYVSLSVVYTDIYNDTRRQQHMWMCLSHVCGHPDVCLLTQIDVCLFTKTCTHI